MGLFKLKKIKGEKGLIYNNKKIIVLIDEKQLRSLKTMRIRVLF